MVLTHLKYWCVRTKKFIALYCTMLYYILVLKLLHFTPVLIKLTF